jgi:hypothetical protein
MDKKAFSLQDVHVECTYLPMALGFRGAREQFHVRATSHVVPAAWCGVRHHGSTGWLRRLQDTESPQNLA